MKLFLPLLLSVILLSSTTASAQYFLVDDSLREGTFQDVIDPITSTTTMTTEETVVGRREARYNHLNRIFNVNGNWVTQFNRVLPDPGFPGTNSDYFSFQGNNIISGENGVISFDTVYFNNGVNNVMEITNYNAGYFSPYNYGQPTGSLMIVKKLYFNNALTTTDRSRPVNGAISFINSADYEGGLTDAQHVDGYVTETNLEQSDLPRGHSGNFVFPVGNASAVYQVERQGNFLEYEATLTVGWIDGNPNSTIDNTDGTAHATTPESLGPGINAVTNIGFWDWHVQNTTDGSHSPQAMSAAQIIRVHIPDLTFTPVAPADLRLVGWSPLTFEWVNLSGATGTTSLEKGTILQGTIPSNLTITALAVGSTNAILPVTFTDFKVIGQGCTAKLEWETSFEQNNSHFLVERSTDGSSFTSIARVSAAGNSNGARSYSYIDESPVSGLNYYRITQVDFDDNQSGTGVKTIRISCDGSGIAFRVYPNPANSQVNIITKKAVAQVSLLSSNGQNVLSYRPTLNTGGTFSLNIHSVPNGIYLLQVINKDGSKEVVKIFKQQ